MKTWQDGLIAQEQLLSWLQNDPAGIEQSLGFSEKYINKKDLSKLSIEDLDKYRLFYPAMSLEYNVMSPLFWVCEELGPFLEEAARTMPFEELQQEDLFVDRGFVILPKTIAVPGILEDGQFIALSWVRQERLRVRYGDDSYNDGPGIIIVGYCLSSNPLIAPLLLPKFSGLVVFQGPFESIVQKHPSISDPMSFVLPQHFLKALWTFCHQRIFIAEKEVAPRAMRKRALKEKRPEPLVSIVTLRRTASTSNKPSESVEWHCRWLVRGHWRNQWCPARKMHRLLWIVPYVKGPVDKPLVVKPKVFNIAR